MLSRAYREVTFATRKMVSRIKREKIKEETWNNCERKIFPVGRQYQCELRKMQALPDTYSEGVKDKLEVGG